MINKYYYLICLFISLKINRNNNETAILNQKAAVVVCYYFYAWKVSRHIITKQNKWNYLFLSNLCSTLNNLCIMCYILWYRIKSSR